MQVAGVHHVAINVSDVDEALAFYVGALGLSVRTDRPDFAFGGAWLDVGDQQIHLVQGERLQDRGQHFALGVDDLDGAIAELRGRGIRVSDVVEAGRRRQAFVSDPAGNRVELSQPV